MEIEHSRLYLGPDLLIGVGMLPIAFWLFIVSSFIFIALTTGNIGLSDLMLILLGGFVACILTSIMSGIGYLWAGRALKGSG